MRDETMRGVGTCAVPSCGGQILGGRTFCYWHSARLPIWMRTELRDHWASFACDEQAWAESVQAAVQHLADAERGQVTA